MTPKSIKVKFLIEETGESRQTEVESEALITQAAFKAGVTIQQTCGGTPSCTDCKVRILEGGEESVFPMEGPENRLLGNVFYLTQERLACQAKIKNDLVVGVPPIKRKDLKKENRFYGSKKNKQKS